MTNYHNKYFTGERSLFAEHDATITNTTFGEGESPLKEGKNLKVSQSVFQWKYPLWYCQHVTVDHTLFETMSRSGIWDTNDITITDSTFQAPKLFRRTNQITLVNDYFADAQETLWHCDDVRLEHVQAHGDYFGMDTKHVYADDLTVVGNYAFDGAEDVEIHNSTFMTKDAFWNCKNVTIYDSVISGEYLAWNTENLTLINCTIQSEQGLCYIKHLRLRNCVLRETTLAFEYCEDVDAEVVSTISSVKNLTSGQIVADGYGEIITDDNQHAGQIELLTWKQQAERKHA